MGVTSVSVFKVILTRQRHIGKVSSSLSSVSVSEQSVTQSISLTNEQLNSGDAKFMIKYKSKISGGRLSLGFCASPLWRWALPAFPYDRCFFRFYTILVLFHANQITRFNFLCRASLFPVVRVLPTFPGKGKTQQQQQQEIELFIQKIRDYLGFFPTWAGGTSQSQNFMSIYQVVFGMPKSFWGGKTCFT